MTTQKPTREMVEAVAQAIYCARFSPGYWGSVDPATRELYINMSSDALRAAFAPSPLAPAQVPEGWQLVPKEPGTCLLDDSPHLLAFAITLHANLSEEQRPNGWSDFSDDQRERLKDAYRAMLSAAPATPQGSGGNAKVEDALHELDKLGISNAFAQAKETAAKCAEEYGDMLEIHSSRIAAAIRALQPPISEPKQDHASDVDPTAGLNPDFNWGGDP